MKKRRVCLFRTDKRAQAACAAAAANSEACGEKDHQGLTVAAREHREEAEEERVDELDQQRPEVARKPIAENEKRCQKRPRAFLFGLSSEQQPWLDLPSQARDKTKGKVPRTKSAHLPSLSESRPKASAAITSALLFIAITAPTNAGLISRATASAVKVPVV